MRTRSGRNPHAQDGAVPWGGVHTYHGSSQPTPGCAPGEASRRSRMDQSSVSGNCPAWERPTGLPASGETHTMQHHGAQPRRDCSVTLQLSARPMARLQCLSSSCVPGSVAHQAQLPEEGPEVREPPPGRPPTARSQVRLPGACPQPSP